MDKKTKRNITGLLQHSATLKSNTVERVNNAIDTLKRSKTKKINFKTVSELSGISTTTLYNNPVLRERISSLRAVKKVDVQESPPPETAVRDRECELRQEIQKLKEEKKMLVEQLVREPIYDDCQLAQIEERQTEELISELVECIITLCHTIANLRTEVNCWSQKFSPQKCPIYYEMYSNLCKSFEDFPAYSKFEKQLSRLIYE